MNLTIIKAPYYRVLFYFAAGGVIASIMVVLSLFWVGFVDQVGFKNEGTALNLSGIPLALGLYGYCYSGHAVFPNIYSSLKEPDQYPSVLFTRQAILYICHICFISSFATTSYRFCLCRNELLLDLILQFLALHCAFWGCCDCGIRNVWRIHTFPVYT